jgi:DNA-binding GntR family transcriptional regulator
VSYTPYKMHLCVLTRCIMHRRYHVPMATTNTSSRLTTPLTRADAVAAELRRMILSGELAGGARLRQQEIAERFGVSTTPVREAFTSLAREGLVRQDAHRGVVVFEASPEDVRENFEIRAALESLAAELAAKAITDEELAALDELLLEMRKTIRRDPAHHNSVLNPRFHSIINTAARRPRLLDLIENLRGAAATYQALLVNTDLTDEYIDAVQTEHEEIVAALRARAPKRAAQAVKKHVGHAEAEILKAMSAQD